MITLFEQFKNKNYNIADLVYDYYKDNDIFTIHKDDDLSKDDIYKAINDCQDVDVYSMKKIKDYTALQFAINRDDIDMVEHLLKNGANPNIPSTSYIFPLISAVEFENFKIVKLLINYGANPNIRNDLNTPLIVSFKKTNILIIKYLLPISDWSITNKEGKDIFDYMDNDYKKTIIKQYSEKYQEYLRQKKANEFNL